jgi:4-hydroxyacetophenone monooxygenase
MGQTQPLTADDAAILAALNDANVPALMATLATLTGDMSFVRGAIRRVIAPVSESDDGLTEEEREIVRDMVLSVLSAFRDGGCVLPPPLSDDEIQEIITFTTGLPVPNGYMPLLQEELAINGEDGRSVQIKGVVSDEALKNFRVLIVGTGMSGILEAIRLKQQGISFLMVDKNEKVGGTWLIEMMIGPATSQPEKTCLNILTIASNAMD